MGQFTIHITASGGHGCQRDVQSMEKVALDCRTPGCIDCKVRRLVMDLKLQGCVIQGAALKHWPGTPHEVVDDLDSLVRSGSFMPPIR